MAVTASDDLAWLSAASCARGFRDGSLSPVDVTAAILRRIEALDGNIHAFISTTPDLALQTARHAEAAFRSGIAQPPLAGIPISIKDLSPTSGIPTSYGVAGLAGVIGDEDAPSWLRVRDAGAVMLGKTSTPPYGWLGVTENEIVGETDNPWKPGHVSGGSSGGAAAALAAGLGPLAVGGDGGGSIRIPAACCGVVGLKPSHGRVPRGPEADAFCTVDAIGPMARTVEDVAMLLSVIAGPVEDEPYMLPAEDVAYHHDLRVETARGYRIAYSPDLGRGPVDAEVAAIVHAAVRHIDGLPGLRVDDVAVSIPDPIDYFRAFWAPALALFQREKPAFTAAIYERYPALEHVTGAGRTQSATEHWHVAHGLRGETLAAFAKLFADYNFLILPTMPLAAFPHAKADAGPLTIAGQAVEWPAIEFHRLTEPFSHTGHPAISIPCGFTAAGLPVGLQIVGRQRDDRGVLALAAAYEATTRWSTIRPPLANVPAH